jgi:enoyl-[acyl-carrier protein] reductase II
LSSNVAKVCELFGIKRPIIQAGMVWVSGGKLAAAASNAGCLGLIGAGSMKPDLLREHIAKAKSLTGRPFGVNVPLLYDKVEAQIETALELGVRIFFTSAGSPKKFTSHLKSKGCVVVHVTSTPELAKKCEDAGVDAVVAEGFEAGGHNGRDEITTMVLIPQVVDAVKIPVIAAGGIGCGRSIAAALSLGASAVQIGSRFAATKESSAHENFKRAIVDAGSDATMLSMKKLVPVRLLKNEFYQQVRQLEESGATKESLAELLGKGRAKRGMLEGDLAEGELEIGQVAALIKDVPSVCELVERLLSEYQQARNALPTRLGS